MSLGVASIWFAVIAFMLVVYVVLDGFDFGVGILHLLVARNDAERRMVLAAIGPVWDGNEVWLIAAGGVLVFAFPRVYAAAFSGFYLPLMMILWLLILRGISIEFRSRQNHPLWRSFWDAGFALSSTVIAVVFGVALGNVVRGVPLDASGYFSAPLFSDFRVGPHPGALDWYTLLVGGFALVVLTGHGALYLRWKTAGALAARATAIARWSWLGIVLLGAATTVATAVVQPSLYARLLARPWTWSFAVLMVAGLAMVFAGLRRQRELSAFVGSALFIAALLAATAAARFPTLLGSTLGDAYSLDVANSSSGRGGLVVGLAWWIPAILLALGYLAYLFRAFSGKVSAGDDYHG